MKLCVRHHLSRHLRFALSASLSPTPSFSLSYTPTHTLHPLSSACVTLCLASPHSSISCASCIAQPHHTGPRRITVALLSCCTPLPSLLCAHARVPPHFPHLAAPLPTRCGCKLQAHPLPPLLASANQCVIFSAFLGVKQSVPPCLPPGIL
uniref:Uncharacterized protein n=1 Tax=Leishmania guyanensis TaxID=5670 RepID=A0A1E1J0H9_LEIGU|nr:Hypothetical protein BN36_2845830 [Leishmania guyanensis]